MSPCLLNKWTLHLIWISVELKKKINDVKSFFVSLEIQQRGFKHTKRNPELNEAQSLRITL